MKPDWWPQKDIHRLVSSRATDREYLMGFEAGTQALALVIVEMCKYPDGERTPSGIVQELAQYLSQEAQKP